MERPRPTLDIDTFQPVPPKVQAAVERATAQTGLLIPVTFAAVADAPYDYEDRLERVGEPVLRSLELWVPERHDLVLMKLIRAYEHDLEVIEEMHTKQPLTLEVLVSRFEREMSHAIADPSKLRLNLALGVERLFGERVADGVLRRLRGRGLDRGTPDR
jgi:hypothetical protein